MNKRSVLQGLFIALLLLPMANSFGQQLLFPVKGTAGAVWDATNKRYLYTYQDISKDPVMLTPIYNEASIYQCDRDGKNIKLFTDIGKKLVSPTGMFIKGSKLYVADYTKIWVINLSDGTLLDQINAPGKSVLDITTDGVNTIYATDVADSKSKIYWIDMTTKAWDTLVCDTFSKNKFSGIYFEASPLKSLYVTSIGQAANILRYDFSGDSIYVVKRTSYDLCFGFTGDGKGNYYLSAWKSASTKNAGAVIKFTGGLGGSVFPLYEYLNLPSDIIYQPIGDTLVVPELNKGNNTLSFVLASPPDIIAPLVDSVIVVDASTLIVYYSEAMNATATMKTGGFYTGLAISTLSFNNTQHTQVKVILSTPLKVNTATNFTIANVQDLAGNAMKQPKTVSLTYKVKSIYENYLKSGLSVYPNPVRNKININYELLQSASVSIELYDILGKKVAEFYNGKQNPNEYQLNYQLPADISDNSIYILKFTVDGNIFMSKILVNK